MTRFLRYGLLAAALAAMVSAQASGQVPKLKKLKDAAKKVVTKPAAPAATDTAAAEPAAAAPADAAKPAGRADPKVWENYDFVPGNKVLFYTDFTEDKVGNFARRLKYKSGPLEVVERDGAKVLRATGRSTFLIPIGGKLPERFTLEIDVIAPEPTDGEHDVSQMLVFEGGPEENHGAQSAEVTWSTSLAWIKGGGQNPPASNVVVPPAMRPLLRSHVGHLRVLMDGPYFKMYVNERRLYNIPELPVPRDSVIRVALNASENEVVYLTSIRVAESETDVLYDALAANGRWATQGILFETGKSDLRPESRPVLKEIASTLTEHADLSVLIEGHTDNVGSPASNLALSEARAAAVKAALVADFAIAPERITTKGLGDTKPAVPNTTAEGRAQNRRVEIVKQ
ncbi:MAG: OmpA family protein [Gemmatimonadales bacterium]